MIELGIHVDVVTARFPCAFGAERGSCLLHRAADVQSLVTATQLQCEHNQGKLGLTCFHMVNVTQAAREIPHK